MAAICTISITPDRHRDRADGLGRKIHSGHLHGEAYQLFAQTMSGLVEAAEKLGVIIGLEGGYNHVLHTPALMKRFLDDIASPNVEVIFDAMNLIHPMRRTGRARSGF